MKKFILLNLMFLSTNAFAQSGLVIFNHGFEIDTYGWGWNTPSAEFTLTEEFNCWATFLDSQRLVGNVDQGTYFSKVRNPDAYSAQGLKVSSEHIQKEECTEWHDDAKELCKTKGVSHFY